MTKLPITLATKLMNMVEGLEYPSSGLKQPLVLKMVEDGVIQTRNSSKSKRIYFINNTENLYSYLQTEFGINDLETYIVKFNDPRLMRSEAVSMASNSKIKTIRTFKGFLVNCFHPIQATLNQEMFTINPIEGTFTFIYDFDSFYVPENIIIVGIENPENFRFIIDQKELFKDLTPLFISRYPQNQSKDLIKWLQKIPNKYLHFGDFDFEGINIFMNEYRKKLGDKSSFFIPKEIEKSIQKHGNSSIYDNQLYKQPDLDKIRDTTIIELIHIIHKHKKGLEQEYFIKKV